MKHILTLLFITSYCMAYADQPVSGYEFATPETRAMQDDDFENPGMTAVDDGRALFHKSNSNGQSCASCHGDNGSKLNTRRIAQYPVYSQTLKSPLTLQRQVQLCWEDKLENTPLIYGSNDAVSLETFVRFLARGEKINVDISGPMKPYYEAGEELYNMRFGQIDMACIHCHVYHQGQRLRGQVLSQGQSNGFPEYRLGSGRITSLHRRLSECFVSFRAQPFAFGSEEFINLEVYVNAKGNGLKIETPAVRY